MLMNVDSLTLFVKSLHSFVVVVVVVSVAVVVSVVVVVAAAVVVVVVVTKDTNLDLHLSNLMVFL